MYNERKAMMYLMSTSFFEVFDLSFLISSMVLNLDSGLNGVFGGAANVEINSLTDMIVYSSDSLEIN